MNDASRQLGRTSMPATAALAALSVALLLTVPAQALPAASTATGQQALATLRHSLNEAAKALVGQERQTQQRPAPAARLSLRHTLRALPVLRPVDSACSTRRSNAPPLLEALLNLPPPTR